MSAGAGRQSVAADDQLRAPALIGSWTDDCRKVLKGSDVTSFRVLQIDHVELFVPDRLEAAAWYQRILGLEVVSEYQKWAANQRGPLMISSDDGNTKLALFEGRPQGSRPTAGFDRVAFRVDARGFMDFLQRLTDRPLKDDQDRPVTPDSVVDHEKAYSVYFCDPYGHRLEVTTYEYEATRAALAGVRGPAR
jgi:catechol 2,3-dioxygenase-like lactoylglutathione lyase family enzyme